MAEPSSTQDPPAALADEFNESAVAGASTATGADTGSKIPPKPEDVRDDITAKRTHATDLREKAEEYHAVEEHHDADARVANQLLDQRVADVSAIDDRALNLHMRQSEVERDLQRWEPDKQAKADEVNNLRRQVGEPVPSDELLDPDGNPKTVPNVPVETDPVKLAALKEQLSTAKAEQLKLENSHADLETERERIEVERGQLAKQRTVAETRVEEQQTRVADLAKQSEAAEKQSVAALDQARQLEGQATTLEQQLPQITTDYQADIAAHPEHATQDAGTIEVHASARERAEAYAEGRREHAADLEQSATNSQHQADAASDGVRDRLQLARQNEQQAADLNQRADDASVQSANLKADAEEAKGRSDQLGSDAEKATAEAARLQAQGRTDEADVMTTRAKALNDDATKALFRYSDLEKQATDIETTAVADREKAVDLDKRSGGLRAEATDLQTQATQLEKQATFDRETAKIQDTVANDIETQLDSGKPFHYVLLNDREGTSADLDVPAPGPDDTVPARTEAPAPGTGETAPTTTAAADGTDATSAAAGATAAADAGADVTGTDVSGAAATTAAGVAASTDATGVTAALGTTGVDPMTGEATALTSDPASTADALGAPTFADAMVGSSSLPPGIGISPPITDLPPPGTSDKAPESTVPVTDGTDHIDPEPTRDGVPGADLGLDSPGLNPPPAAPPSPDPVPDAISGVGPVVTDPPDPPQQGDVADRLGANLLLEDGNPPGPATDSGIPDPTAPDTDTGTLSFPDSDSSGTGDAALEPEPPADAADDLGGLP